MTGLRDHLRQATNERHEALHRHPLLAPLNGGSPTLSQYRDIITAFSYAYATIVEDGAVKKRIGYDGAPVGEWLRLDRQALGMGEPEAARCGVQLAGLAEMIGFWYVRQGSTLGGQFIAKGLERSLSLVPGRDQFFFHGFGKQTGPEWKRFLMILDANESNCDFDVAARSAVRCFDHIGAACDAVFAQSSRKDFHAA